MMGSPLLRVSRSSLSKVMRYGRVFFSSQGHAAEQVAVADGVYRDVEANHSLRSTESTGLYGFGVLSTPQGFRKFVEDAIQRSEELIAHIKMLPSSEDIIRAMDDISNTVCMVVDSAEFCRNTHPDREYVEEAERASRKINEYLNYLNTNHVLYNAVSKSEKKGVLKMDEAQRAAWALRTDFEKGGIHLSADKQALVNKLNLEIISLGKEFTDNIVNYPGEFDVFPASRIPKRLHSQLIKIVHKNGFRLKSKWEATKSGLRILTDSDNLSDVLKWTDDEEIRKKAYIIGHSSPKINLGVLDNLISARKKISENLGYKSYADFALAPTMASSPDVVMSFLDDMSKTVKQKAEKEIGKIRDFKRRMGNGNGDVEPWDEQYYTCLMRGSECNLEAADVAAYFSLKNCLEGLNLIVKSLFGASFDKVPLAPGESWHPNVQKLVLHHPEEGDLGCMYLDLYARQQKYPGCAHFAIKGGKRLSLSKYQLPVVVLVCNFSSQRGSSRALLSHGELETLFHEFGHALHSLLSRTDYQHFSGTRTVLDFAETPSNLFEYFAWDYRVLKRFAKHYLTGEAIPENVVISMNKAKKMFRATELQRQILYSAIDQTLFGKQHLSSEDTTSIVANLNRKYSSWNHVEGTHWHTHFAHLVNYGAGYYSYLYARCFASSIWRKVCLEDPLSLETGSIIRNGFLKYGGSKDPAVLLRGVLGESVLQECDGGGVKPSTDDLFEELNL